jgi:hypothetical protein
VEETEVAPKAIGDGGNVQDGSDGGSDMDGGGNDNGKDGGGSHY